MGIDLVTPQEWWEALNARWEFDLDVAADDKNHKCERYFTIDDNALEQEWTGRVWCAPPWDEPELYQWVEKAHDEYASGRAEMVMVLLPERLDAKWFARYSQSAVVLIPTEIPYDIPDGYEVEQPFLMVWGRPSYGAYRRLVTKGFATFGEG
jgi:phage N-6-adenine-methyltransferase